jgi:hypothetical protein
MLEVVQDIAKYGIVEEGLQFKSKITSLAKPKIARGNHKKTHKQHSG